MFKLLKSLSKSLGGNKSASAGKSKTAKSGGSVLDQVVKGRSPVNSSGPPKSAEELCEITPKMPKDAIMARLKLLYRRFNRSASSLDAGVRDEAEIMLNAIVEVREKHFGEI